MVKEQKELTIHKLKNSLNTIISDLESSYSIYKKDKYVELKTYKNHDDTYSLIVKFIKPVSRKTKSSIKNILDKYLPYLYKKEKMVTENRIVYTKKYIKKYVFDDIYENIN